ncbi:unnamed protein product, partial [Meganyctiphanes norvegica]
LLFRSSHASPGVSGNNGLDLGDAHLNAELQEKYIDLMCQINPTQVYAYLKAASGYRLEQTLQICRKHEQQESIAFLLERAGDIKGAFEILLDILKERVNKLLSSLEEDSNNSSETLLLGHVQAQVVKLVRVCQLGSSQL